MDMKKTLPALVLLTLIAGGLSLGFVAQADVEGPIEGCTMSRDINISDCPGEGVECLFSSTEWNCGVCCLVDTMYKITDWIFVVLIGIAAIFVILGAMNLLMSGGSEQKVTSGRNYIMYAFIGLIVGFLAKAIPAIVVFIVG